MNDTHVTLFQVVTAVTVILAIALIAFVVVRIRAKRGLPMPEWLPIPVTAVLTLAAASSLALAVICFMAYDHGMYSLDIRADRIIRNIQMSPHDQSKELAEATGWSEGETPHNPKDAFVVIYRFTCPDCEGVKDELQARLANSGYPYWFVSSRSPLGHAMCELYGVDEVPSLISFDDEGRASLAVIYETKDGKPVLSESAWKFAAERVDPSLA